MALARPKARGERGVQLGRAKPRLAPPVPARSLWRDAAERAAELGIVFMPWQCEAERYIEAVGLDDLWLYPEVAAVVSRQQGKTELLIPHIIRRLRMGRRIMHTAQNRELPREVFHRVADVITKPGMPKLKSRPRFANGQEEIRLTNGGLYRIVAPTRGGARGPSNDDVIVDEIRELADHDFIAAAKPTLTASPNPQILYLSNAGDEDSAVLNALRKRSDEDPSLAYLEWSAAPERAADDRKGWLEANPAIGHMPQVLPYLEREYRSNLLAGTMAIFETEHLCRWVPTMRERLLADGAWSLCQAPLDLSAPPRSYMGISMDPDGRRACAVLAWQIDASTIGLRILLDVSADPIDTSVLGRDLRLLALRSGVVKVGFDPMSDAELAKFFKQTEPIAGQKYANASARFVTLVAAERLRWRDADAIGDDLLWTARKPHDETGTYQAVRAKDDRPIPAVLAAIRAVWLASGPASNAPARIY